jgi:hypothetical protein
MLESPLVGAVPPTLAAKVPACAPELTTAVVPVEVQPLRLPVSNPPFTIPLVVVAVTVSETVVVWVLDGPVPVTVMVLVPAGVDDEVVIVSVELAPLLTGFGLNDAEAPEGRPDALRLTLTAEPLVIAVAMLEVPLPPWATLMLAGLAEIEKSFATAAVTVSAIDVVWVLEVPVPVTVTVLVPVGVEAAVVIVSVELPPEAIEAGLKEAVAPEGRPEAVRLTVCADPLVTVVEMVEVPLAPRVTLTLAGLAEIEKSLTAGPLTTQLFCALLHSCCTV